jgi:hypothetical protein
VQRLFSVGFFVVACLSCVLAVLCLMFTLDDLVLLLILLSTFFLVLPVLSLLWWWW